MSYTIAAVLAGTALFSLCGTLLFGRWLLPLLHKLKFGQTILDVGPSWHKNKQGTPTMGGITFILGTFVSLLISLVFCETALDVSFLSASVQTQVRLFAGIGLALCCGLIGLTDDYIKVVKKRNLGLTGRQKLLAQLLVGVAYASVLYFTEADRLFIPMLGTVSLGYWFIPLCALTVIGTSNAVNLNDGIDGLCTSVSFIAVLSLLIAGGMTYNYSQSLLAAAAAGALAGFLVYNVHPAKMFMGDTGSLFIGGLLCALAFGIGHPLLLVPLGIAYILDTLSVILQVSYFKLTHGKRLFKMSPIHHHFELCGWKENKIVIVFSSITLVCSAAALLYGVWCW